MAEPEHQFSGYNLDAMNETDVREAIVFPLLRELGYRHGSPANIVTEKKLRYANSFLGRKKDTDPPLAGRADYICDVVGYGRWVIEAKPPTVPISTDDIEQAYSYAAHPEIGALFFVVTNGREFQVYRIGNATDPIFSWKLEETMDRMMAIRNLLGPDAIRRRVEIHIDLGKPLALGYGSHIKIAGGSLTYQDFSSNWGMLDQTGVLEQQKAAIVGGEIYRLPDGRIEGHVEQAGPYDLFTSIAQMGGADILKFSCSEEYISTQKSDPTIMQNFVDWKLAAGTPLPASLLIQFGGLRNLPFKVYATALTEVVGYIDGVTLKGSFTVKFSLALSAWQVRLPAGAVPSQIEADSAGIFEVNIQDWGGRG
ncbi:hypothetical protein [Dongia sp.]|uniref:hypothetical protein n=1 Tax=Dongia sp. TaxID=1977262 RepID=UPI0035AF506A